MMNNNIDEVLQSVFENSSDPDDACERVSALYQPHDLKLCHPRDQLRAQMKHRDVRDTSLSRLLYNAEIQIDSEPFKDFYLVMLPSSGHFNVKQNFIEGVASPSKPIILDADKHIDMRWSEDCSNLIYKVNRRLLDETLYQSYGIEAKNAVEFNSSTTGLASLSEFSEALGNFLINNPYANDMAKNPELFEKIEQVLALSLLSQGNSYSEAILNAKYGVRPRVVIRAKEFIEENYTRKLTVLDIANAVGVSARSLQKGFEQYEHTTPMLYLRKWRLRRARELLVFSRNQNIRVKVSDIAMSCGFFHFGNFSKLYCESFGETPSKTLSGRL
ncbi:MULTISPECIES: AraC family transcriptional regulator [Spongiibacter]|uniref:AraC family transcriptional regulator n=1 Tax=Spongiibacter thalassae TaxID=2721624 RepID=A0ABX1GHB1_9GAMM|nr:MULTISPECIES: AraC family transcriptional regulator [Spongiibacter]MAY37921.1 AraC family transcriptional regulator [Spongiibacter sp.]MBI57706.1 AraC family transcriptional regulator [Spongiibacter sp.]NKI18599.1 AraC family transcriptional regulator [Spongiibacter thalassae]|tara:strand:- start:18476 stop:19465 length:990 start_codon:yes stop_codon:yes gene_type:complete